MPDQKQKYRALSSGLIARIGAREYTVEEGKIYEWGDEEAQIYLRNAPENFQIITEDSVETLHATSNLHRNVSPSQPKPRKGAK
ncbi:MAG: hypothetical protein L6Q29_04025 [Candidatus Pacebacteria bacterium]|nr:hypothetical protein [Candidatus Paceibacterota bacterium]NUQ42660.1 hypothetical protein [Calditrichaceae bacterium]